MCGPDNLPADGEIDAVAASIIAVMDGLQVQWLLDPDAVVGGRDRRTIL